MHKVGFALGPRIVVCIALDSITTPGVSEKKRVILQYCHRVSCTSRTRAKLWSKPGTWSGDDGDSKHLAHPLWQLKWHHGGLLVAGKACSPAALHGGTAHWGGQVWRC